MTMMTKQFPRTFSLLCAGCLSSGFLTAGELQQNTEFKRYAPEAVSTAELAESTAQGGIQNVNYLVNSNLDATLTDNTAINTFSGDNIIDGNSFSGASGIVSIIQNTGNNVIIQDSTVVNVSIFP